MAVFDKIFSSEIPEDWPQVMKELLLQVKKEGKHYQETAQRAEAAAERLEKATQPVLEAEKRVKDLLEGVVVLKELRPEVMGLKERIDSLTDLHRNAVEQVRDVAAEVQLTRTEMDSIHNTMNSAAQLKMKLEGFMEMGGPFKAMHADAQQTKEFLDLLSGQVARMEEVQGAALRENDKAKTKMEMFSNSFSTFEAQVGAATHKVEEMQATLGPLAEVAARLPDTKRELRTLEALANYVNQKVAAVERQREMVDRVSQQADRLRDMVQHVDKEISAQKENAHFLDHLQRNVDELKGQHRDLLGRSEDIIAAQEKIEKSDRQRRDSLTGMREELLREVQEIVAKFRFEAQGMESTTERIQALRTYLQEVEGRFSSLDQAGRVAMDLDTKVEGINKRLEVAGGDIADLDRQAERVREVQREVTRLDRVARETSHRVEKLQAPAVQAIEEAERRVVQIDRAVGEIEGRAKQVAGFAERMHSMQKDLHQQQGTLDAAMEQLRATFKLKQEAQVVASEMASHVQAFRDGVDQSSERAAKVDELLAGIEERSQQLQFAEKRLAQFERSFKVWNEMEQELGQVVEQTEQRRALMDSVKGELSRLSEMAESTVQAVRTIATAREEISQHRDQLEAVLVQVKDVQVHREELESRRRQVADAEDRLTRADALLMDVQSSLEMVRGQKQFLDRVVETAGSLSFQAKEAEMLIEALRGERQSIKRNEEEVAGEERANPPSVGRGDLDSAFMNVS
ncbi:MAG: hypothetical protein OEY63_03700 [Gemmatimonadota bacterium]|nr:hypothetical protein [Gemmatimonadota bacterium]MDH5804177.1 hypothetical protein [Gemmatimonadota bacterium]